MSRLVRIGLVQMDCVLGDIKSNLERALGYVQEAAQREVALLCFPELFSTGYIPALPGSQRQTLAETIAGPTIQCLARAAREYSLHIIAPIALEKSMPGVVYDSAVVIAGDGKVLGGFDKIHLTLAERACFRAGDRYPVFATDLGKIGTMICYDAGFPEVARILALRGAEYILAPCAFCKPDKYMWDIYFRSRALENALFVAATNRVGHEGEWHLFGSAVVSDPYGSLIAQTPEDCENLLTVDVDLDQVPVARTRIPYLRDRRPELYQPLVDSGG